MKWFKDFPEGSSRSYQSPPANPPVLWAPSDSDFDSVAESYLNMKVDPTALAYDSFVEILENTAKEQVARSRPPEGTPLFPVPNPWKETKPVEKKDVSKVPEADMLDKERRMQAVMWEYLTKGTINGSTPRDELEEKSAAMLARLKMLRATLEDVYKEDVPAWENIVIDDPLKEGDPRSPRGRDPSGFIPKPDPRTDRRN